MKLTITSVAKRARAAKQSAARDVDEADIAAAIRADRDELSIAVLALARHCEAQGTTASLGAALVLHELSTAITESL